MSHSRKMSDALLENFIRELRRGNIAVTPLLNEHGFYPYDPIEIDDEGRETGDNSIPGLWVRRSAFKGKTFLDFVDALMTNGSQCEDYFLLKPKTYPELQQQFREMYPDRYASPSKELESKEARTEEHKDEYTADEKEAVQVQLDSELPSTTPTVNILMQTHDNKDLVAEYRQACELYRQVFSVAHDESDPAFQTEYYRELKYLERVFSTPEIRNYRQAPMYHAKVIAAIQAYELSTFLGYFQSTSGQNDQGLRTYLYKARVNDQEFDIPIQLKRAPENIEERFLLAEAIRLQQQFLDAALVIEPAYKLQMIGSLYEGAKNAKYEPALEMVYVIFKPSPNHRIHVWVSKTPKGSEDNYQLAMQILSANNNNLQGNKLVGENYWVMNDITVENAVLGFLKGAAKKGHQKAISELSRIDEETKASNKENIENERQDLRGPTNSSK